MACGRVSDIGGRLNGKGDGAGSSDKGYEALCETIARVPVAVAAWKHVFEYFYSSQIDEGDRDIERQTNLVSR